MPAADHLPLDGDLQARADDVRPVPVWLWFGLAVLLLFVLLRAQRSYDDVRFWAYVTQCAHAGNWEGIYDKVNNPFAFAPYVNLSMTALLYPLGYLPKPVMRLVLTLLIITGWYVLYRFMREGIANQRQGFRNWIPVAAGAPILGMLLAGRYLLNDLACKQLNMITFAAACLGMTLLLPRRRPRTQLFGGLLLAFSIGLKLTTLPFLAMLLIKRAWRRAAALAVASFGFLWLLPHWLMGPEQHLRVSRQVEGNIFNMWLQVKDTTQTWSFTNFLHYRIYIDPLWAGLTDMSPRTYQMICVVVTILVGLPALHVMLRRPWSEMSPLALWEEIAVVGVAWALIDPDGRTHHYVTLVPAFCYVMYRRLEAWHAARQAPSGWQWAAYLAICLTNLWLVRLPEPYAHHVYMHYGLYAGGMMLLYGVTYREIWLAERKLPMATVPIGEAPPARPTAKAA